MCEVEAEFAGGDDRGVDLQDGGVGLVIIGDRRPLLFIQLSSHGHLQHFLVFDKGGLPPVGQALSLHHVVLRGGVEHRSPA